MPRTKQSQSKHDSEVRRTALNLKEKGYDVKADVRGFPQPEPIGHVRPDVVAQKGREKKIIEVETPDSVNTARDKKQQHAFDQAAKRAKDTTYIRKIAR